VQCNSNNACKIKLSDEGNDDDAEHGTCYGTVLVGCGYELEFYFSSDGQYEYAVVPGRRQLVTTEAAEAEAAVVVGEEHVFPTLGEKVKGSTTTTSSSSLRGGAKGWKAMA
jgi:hypothetical protein